MSFEHVLAKSGLTKVELARIYGVSRQLIYYWSKVGPPRYGTYTARMAEVITAALENAMAKGLLPLGAISKEARRARVERMAKTCQSLKPAPARG